MLRRPRKQGRHGVHPYRAFVPLAASMVRGFEHAFDEFRFSPELPAAVNPRIDLLLARADLDECDLVARTKFGQVELAFLYQGDGTFISNRAAIPPLARAAPHPWRTDPRHAV